MAVGTGQSLQEWTAFGVLPESVWHYQSLPWKPAHCAYTYAHTHSPHYTNHHTTGITCPYSFHTQHTSYTPQMAHITYPNAYHILHTQYISLHTSTHTKYTIHCTCHIHTVYTSPPYGMFTTYITHRYPAHTH